VPVKAGAKLQQLLPYALEEHLADDIDDLHFAIGRRAGEASARRSPWWRARCSMSGWRCCARAASNPRRSTPTATCCRAIPDRRWCSWKRTRCVYARPVLPGDAARGCAGGGARDRAIRRRCAAEAARGVSFSTRERRSGSGTPHRSKRRVLISTASRSSCSPADPWRCSRSNCRPRHRSTCCRRLRSDGGARRRPQGLAGGGDPAGVSHQPAPRSKFGELQLLKNREHQLDASIRDTFRTAMPGTRTASMRAAAWSNA